MSQWWRTADTDEGMLTKEMVERVVAEPWPKLRPKVYVVSRATWEWLKAIIEEDEE